MPLASASLPGNGPRWDFLREGDMKLARGFRGLGDRDPLGLGYRTPKEKSCRPQEGPALDSRWPGLRLPLPLEELGGCGEMFGGRPRDPACVSVSSVCLSFCP